MGRLKKLSLKRKLNNEINVELSIDRQKNVTIIDIEINIEINVDNKRLLYL